MSPSPKSPPIVHSTHRVGSVFLGDIQRHRHLASSNHSGSTHSTPPSSPPPGSGSLSGAFIFHRDHHHPNHHLHSPPFMPSAGDDLDIDLDPAEKEKLLQQQIKAMKDLTEDPALSTGLRGPGKVDPMLALELRLRWLEAIILGLKQDTASYGGLKGKGKEESYSAVNLAAAANLNPGETLSKLAETVQKGLEKAVEGNDGLKKFMDKYDKHAHLLTPSFALSGILPDPPSYDKMTPEEANAFLTEMEPDIRAASRDMIEIDALEKKDVLGAGKLPESENLRPRLDALLKAQQEDEELAESLEIRIAALVERHATYVDTLSELFVAWDDTVTEAEDRLNRMEREKAEKLRLGLA